MKLSIVDAMVLLQYHPGDQKLAKWVARKLRKLLKESA